MKPILRRIIKASLRSPLGHHIQGRLNLAAWLFAPSGHFYSPIPSLVQVRRDEQRIFSTAPRELTGIDLNEEQQLLLLGHFQQYYDSQPFSAEKAANRRYFFDNPNYSYSDAIFLYCMIRFVRPRRIVEVGSGYSSCLILDTNEIFFGNRIACKFIEPYPKLLRALLRKDDFNRIDVLDTRIQDAPLECFRALEAGDILFIDSTHVSKVGSDVNYIFSEVLPVLRPGVYVHLHDIFYPFEYPKEWIYEGRAWTEAYLLRAFLAFNSAYEIVLFNSFLERFHRERFFHMMPLCLKNEGGSIWLRRTDNAR
jgi:predicted O-methyltransferase YrrM